MSELENVKVIARFLEEVINQGRLEQADELVAADFVELDPLPGQRQGREGLKEVIGMLRGAFPDMHWVVDETVASGDKVVTRFTWTGTHRGTFLGIPATGRGVNAKGVVIDRPPKVAHYGMKQLYFSDPDGFGLCFQWKAI